MSLIAQKLISASGATEATDDDFNLVTGLYHFDGANGAQNNTFLDDSYETHTVTATTYSTPVVQGTFSPFSAEEGKWSTEFPIGVATNKIQWGGSASFAFGTGAFTVEGWAFVTADNYDYSRLFAIGPYYNDNNSVGITVDHTDNSSKTAFYAYAAGGVLCLSTSATPRGEWFHWAVTRDSTGDFRLFTNGNLDSTNTSYRTTDISPGGNQPFVIGSTTDRAVSEPYEGFISNVRVVKGTAVYTSSFTPSTSPLTDITNTVLLTSCSNRHRDKSSIGQTITLTGEPRIKPFSPFAPSAAYDPAVNGGSGFFPNGIGGDSYLSVSDATDFDFGTGDYTLEAWFYPTLALSAIGNFNLPFAIEGGNNYWGWTDASFGAGYNGLTNHVDTLDSNSGSDSDNPDLFAWTHIVYQVTSGTNNWYKNGVRVLNATAQGHSASATGFRVGRSPSYNNHRYGGFISDVRILKGANAYSNASTLTVPTAPLTNVSYCKLLLNFTNAAMFDQSGKNMVATIGNAQLDTSVKKLGTASLELDNTGDYLTIPPSSFMPFGTGDFTIECFVRFSTVSSSGIFQLSNGTLNATTRGPAAGCSASTGKWGIYYGTTWYEPASSQVPSTNTWYHVAFVRNSGTSKLYIDGTEMVSASDTTNYTDTYFTIGGWYSTGYLMHGYIDEFRITHKARYTSTFTAPTAEFANR